MPTLAELNGSWEERLTDLHAQTWTRMKTVGATAGWEDPVSGLPDVPFTVRGGDGFTRARPNEFYEFVVRFRGNELVREALHSVPADTHVASTLFRAARMLETLGVQVIPR